MKSIVMQSLAQMVRELVDLLRRLTQFVHFTDRLIVATGFPWTDANVTEVFDLNDLARICPNLEDFPLTIREASGGFLANQMGIICGGFDENAWNISNQCFRLDETYSRFEPFANLTYPRSRHAAVEVNGTLWLSGGEPNLKSSTEFLFPDGSSQIGPEMPVSLRDHCVTILPDLRAIILGGYNGDEYSNQTYIYDFIGQKWNIGDAMNFKRNEFGCSWFHHNALEKTVVMAAGGHDSENNHKSVEFLDLEMNQWLDGPDLPFDFWYGMSVVRSKRDSLLLIGGYSRLGYQAKLTELTCDYEAQACQWTFIENAELLVPRLYHVSLIVPKNETNR